MYMMDTEKVNNGESLVVYGFTGHMPAETGNINDTRLVLRCGEFINPETKKEKEEFSITIQTQRYTYKKGPVTILQKSVVNMDEDMIDNDKPTTNDPDPYVSTIVSAQCDFSNSYAGLFKPKTIGGSNYKVVPNGLVAYVEFTIEMLETRHDKIVIDLSGMKKPDSGDVGRSSDQSCWVRSGVNKADSEKCSWTGDNNNKQLTISLTDRIVVVRAQVEMTGTGCFTKVTAKKGTTTVEQTDTTSFTSNQIAATGDMSLWGTTSGTSFSLMDGDASANTAGIAVQM